MDSLDKLPLPKNIKYSDEEKDVHSRYIESDETYSPSKEPNNFISSNISIKNVFIIFILFCIFANSYFHTFLDTITYFNGSPIKIYAASGVLFLISSALTLFYIK